MNEHAKRRLRAAALAPFKKALRAIQDDPDAILKAIQAMPENERQQLQKYADVATQTNEEWIADYERGDRNKNSKP